MIKRYVKECGIVCYSKDVDRLEEEIEVLKLALETVAGECNLLDYCENDCKECQSFRIASAIDEARKRLKRERRTDNE